MYSDRFKEMFESIYAYAKTMQYPAMRGTACLYRSPNGPCLVGFVITDEEAKTSGPLDFSSAFERGLMPSLSWLNEEEQEMLSHIQNAHDVASLESNWKQTMMEHLDKLRQEINA